MGGRLLPLRRPMSRSMVTICGLKSCSSSISKDKTHKALSPRSRLSSAGVGAMMLLDRKNVSSSCRNYVAARAELDSAVEAVAEMQPSQAVVTPPTFQQAIQRLQVLGAWGLRC